LKEKIKEEKASKKMDHGKLSKWKKKPMGSFVNLTERKEEQVGKALKMRVMWT
jgi:hypothetical protein